MMARNIEMVIARFGLTLAGAAGVAGAAAFAATARAACPWAGTAACGEAEVAAGAAVAGAVGTACFAGSALSPIVAVINVSVIANRRFFSMDPLLTGFL
jgi:hypothetical protein